MRNGPESESESDPASASGTAGSPGTESIEIQLDGRRHRVGYVAGDTLLGAARRAALKPPFNCSAGNCGTCIAFLVEGEVSMRLNNVLGADEVEEGWILTCQAVPRSRAVVIDYDR